MNFTSEEVSSLPLANVSPSLRVTVYSVGAVNSADSAMFGSTSGLPYGESTSIGNTWICTASEPLSYAPAGSRLNSVSVVPTAIVPPPPSLPPPPSMSSVSAHAASTSASVAATPRALATRRCR